MKYFEVSCEIRPFSQDAADVLSAVLAEIGFESFSQTENGVLAYIQQSVWSEDAMKEVVGNFCLPGVEIRYTKADAPDEDWNQVWEEEGFQPIIIPAASPVPSKGGVNGKEVTHVTPPLEGTGEAVMIVVHDVKHTNVPPAQYDIVITPRLAFGTGSHSTTRLILRTLARLDLEGKDVIDAGTGTGILAIMAMKRGASYVFAYDIDEWSVENTKDNLLLNHIQTLSDSPLKGEKQKVSPLRGGLEGSVAVVCGDSSVLEGQAKADLLIANINRNILLQDLPRFAKVVKDKGKMILSGFYQPDVDTLTEAALQHGFFPIDMECEGDWAMLLFEADALGRRDV